VLYTSSIPIVAGHRSKAFNEIRDTQLTSIDIDAPRNSFEKGIVQAYNKCRRTYLSKYIDELSNRQIDVLLKDNYIQRTDIVNILNNEQAK